MNRRMRTAKTGVYELEFTQDSFLNVDWVRKLARIFRTHRSLTPFRWNALIPLNDKMNFSPFILVIEWIFWRVNAHTEISIFFPWFGSEPLIKYSRLLSIFGSVCARARKSQWTKQVSVNSRPIYAVCNQLKWFESSVEWFKRGINIKFWKSIFFSKN